MRHISCLFYSTQRFDDACSVLFLHLKHPTGMQGQCAARLNCAIKEILDMLQIWALWESYRRFVVVNSYTYGCLQTLLPASSRWAACRGRWASLPQGRRETSLDDKNTWFLQKPRNTIHLHDFNKMFAKRNMSLMGGDGEVFALPVVDSV